MQYNRMWLFLAACLVAVSPSKAQAVERKTTYPILNDIRDRWSSRSLSGDPITHDTLMTLFEAARWAPSSYNNQPWRYIYAERESVAWSQFLSFLVDQNKVWAQNAAALIVVVSKDTFDFSGEPSRTHSFDAGASWENMAIQGVTMGLVVHGMGGFDYERVKKELTIPDGYTVEAMIAVGLPGIRRDLPKELQDMEQMSDRKLLSEIVFDGTFNP